MKAPWADSVNRARLRLLRHAANLTADEFLEEVLDEAEILSGSCIAFYHGLGRDEETLLVQAWSTRTRAETCVAAAERLHHPVSDAGIWADCIRKRRPVVHNDCASLPHRKGMPAGHAVVRRMLVVPVFRGRRIVAVLGVGNKSQDYSDRDVETMTLYADLTWDIGEHKRTEETLKQLKERFDLATRSASIGMWEWNLRRDALVVDNRVVVMHGLSQDDLLGTFDAWLNHVHPDDRETAREVARRVLRGDDPRGAEFRVVWPDVSVHHLSMLGLVQTNSDGQPVRVVGVAADITARREAEERLRKLHVAAEQSPAGIVIADRTGAIEYVNPRLVQLTGYEAAELIGQNVRILERGLPPSPDRDRLWEEITSGDVWSGEFQDRKKDGTLCWERAVVTPVFDTAGAITHFVALKEDITQQRQLEDELRQAQKMEAFGQLASGVAHDFNNILTVIRGNAALMQPPGGAATRQDGPLDQILSAVERATRLTRQLLLFSRRQIAQKKEVDLNALVADMSKMLKRLIGEHIMLEARFAPGVLTVQADLGMIEQVLMNLAVNARDAMPNGGRLVIETSVMEAGATEAASHGGVGAGECVRLTVRDTGCGIEPEDLPHIFEPFFTTKGTGRGTGLGLATVQGIVQQHGGWVDVDTEREVGTAFHVYLPRSNGRVGERTERRKAGDGPRGTETILVVEDEPDVRRLLRSVLEDHGYRVLEATSGVNALEVWSGHRDEIDLLVTDIVMPGGLSGWELGQRLLRERPELKVLHTSGYSDEMLGEAAALRGTPNLLEKPFGPIEMLRRIRERLENG
jgi:PAS domain S-box-containing protein